MKKSPTNNSKNGRGTQKRGAGVSFTDPPVLTWHRPIYFSYLAVVSGTLLNIRARGPTCWGVHITIRVSAHVSKFNSSCAGRDFSLVSRLVRIDQYPQHKIYCTHHRLKSRNAVTEQCSTVSTGYIFMLNMITCKLIFETQY